MARTGDNAKWQWYLKVVVDGDHYFDDFPTGSVVECYVMRNHFFRKQLPSHL